MTRRGLTLIEMLIALISFGVIAGAFFITSLLSQRSYDSAGAYVSVQQQARWAFDKMVNELRQAGNVAIRPLTHNQWLDFQLARSYDAAGCGGICWGTDDPAFPTGWLHYALDASNPANPRYMRCATATAGEAMPAGFAGCRVLANNVDAAPATTSFSVNGPPVTIVTVNLRITVVSLQLPGGSMATSMSSRVRLRNL